MRKNRKWISFLLSLVLVLSVMVSHSLDIGSLVQAESDGGYGETLVDMETVPQTVEMEPVQTYEEPAAPEIPAEAPAEVPAETETPAEPEAPAETETPAEPETPAPAEVPAEAETPAENTAEAAGTEPAAEVPAEQQEAPAEEPQPVENEAMTLYHEVYGAEGIEAYLNIQIPAGAFQAENHRISMGVDAVGNDTRAQAESRMADWIPENHELKNNVMYRVYLMVDGEKADPAKPVLLTLTPVKVPGNNIERVRPYRYEEYSGELHLLRREEGSIQWVYDAQSDWSEQSSVNFLADEVHQTQILMTRNGVVGFFTFGEKVLQDITYVAECDGITVTAVAKEGVLPQGAELRVQMIGEDSAVEEALDAEGIEYDGYLAMDISFVLDGAEVEPEGEVQIRTEVENDLIREDADMSTLEMLHLDESGAVEAAQVDVVDTCVYAEEEVTVSTFAVESFSTFVLKWSDSGATLNIKCVDTNGDEIGTNKTVTIRDWTKFSTLAPAFDGYILEKVTIGSSTTDYQQYQVKYSSDKGWRYRRDSDSDKISIRGDVKFVYRRLKEGEHVNKGYVHHIDIVNTLTATVVINGTSYDVEFTIGTSDGQYITYSGAYRDGTSASPNESVEITTNSDENGTQVRFVTTSGKTDGTKGFPIGTKEDPVCWSVNLKKTLTIYVKKDGTATTTKPSSGSYETYQVPINVSAVTNYWDSTNICPELTSSRGGTINWANGEWKGFSGIDLKLNNGSGSANTYGYLTIQKNVSGVTLEENRDYTFNIYEYDNGTKGDLYKTATVSVGSEGSGQTMLAQIPLGTYYVEEVSDSAQIYGYTVTTTYEKLSGDSDAQIETLTKDDINGIVLVTNTYTEKPKWTLTYNSNSGDHVVENIIDSASYYYDDTVDVHNTKAADGSQIDVAPVWDENNIFVKWNTAADGSGVDFTAGDQITIGENDVVYKNGEATSAVLSDADELILYAQWEPKTITQDGTAFILVSKTFSGLTYNQISGLNKFKITVKDEAGKETELTTGTPGVQIAPAVEDPETVQDYTFTWKVMSGTGTYIISESGETVNGYQVTTQGTGNSVSVENGSWQMDGSSLHVITANNENTFVVGANRMMMASFSGNGTKYMIWSYEELSVTQKAAVIDFINNSNSSDVKTFRTGKADMDNVDFYYGAGKISEGIVQKGGTVKVVDGKIVFTNKEIWTHVLGGSYGWGEGTNADISISNTYARQYKASVEKTWKDCGSDIPDHLYVALYDETRVAADDGTESVERSRVEGVDVIDLAADQEPGSAVWTYTSEYLGKPNGKYVFYELQPADQSVDQSVVEDGGTLSVDGCDYTAAYTLPGEAEADPADNALTYYTEITNTLQKKAVTLVKVDADNNGAPLAGVGFKLYKAKADGTFEAADENLLESLTSDDKGVIFADSLKNGIYYLTETTPAGYFDPAGNIKIVVTKEGVTAAYVTDNGENAISSSDESEFIFTIENHRKYRATLKKTWENCGENDIPEKLYVALYDETKTEPEGGTEDGAAAVTRTQVGDVIELTASDKGEWEYTVNDLAKPNGRYVFYELQPAEDGSFALAADILSLNGCDYTVAYSHPEKPAEDDDKVFTYSTEITNTLQKKAVKFVKTDADNAETLLAGAEFDLYAADEGNMPSDDKKEEFLLQHLISDSEGGVIFAGDLKNGTYFLIETKAPAGYFVLQDPIRIVVTEDNVTVTCGTEELESTDETEFIFRISNNRKYQAVVTKTWENCTIGNKAYIPEKLYVALFEEAGDTADSVTRTQVGEIIELTASNSWTAAVSDLVKPNGRYVFYELQPKAGETITAAPVISQFDVITGNAIELNTQDYGVAYAVSESNEENQPWIYTTDITNTLKTSTIKVDKVSSSDNSVKLKDAEFKLTSKEDADFTAIVKTTDRDGVIEFDNLPNGTYILEETKAPDGYSLNTEKFEITVKYSTLADDKGAAVHVQTVENTAVYSLPSTGGKGIYGYIISAMILMMGSALIVYKRRCREVLKIYK